MNREGRGAANGPSGLPLERENLQSQIRARLEEQLLSGKLNPGRKLPLRRLAADMGTSLMPVRDALQHLESIGALEAGSNRTLAVPILAPSELRNLVEIRFLLEGMAVERVALRTRQCDLQEIGAKLAFLEKCRKKGDLIAYRHAHWAFHLGIVEVSGISALVNLVRSLWLQIGPNVKISAGDPISADAANAYHRDIFAAISAGDPEQSRRALEADIFYGLGTYGEEAPAGAWSGRI